MPINEKFKILDSHWHDCHVYSMLPFYTTSITHRCRRHCVSDLSSSEFNTWFESGTDSLNGAVKPANSVLFPDIPNCSFYKWSAQMFLWLTSPATGSYGSSGLVMNSPAFYDVSLPDVNGDRTYLPHSSGFLRTFNIRTAQHGALDLPIIMERRSLRLLEIIPPVIAPSGRQLILDQNGNEIEIGNIRFNDNRQPVILDINGNEIKETKAILKSAKDSSRLPFLEKLNKIENFDRTSLVQKIAFKNGSVFVDLFGNFHEVEQGQADGGILMAQNGSLVYYSLTVNNVMALYRTKLGNTVPNGTKFPLTQADLNSISSFAIAHNRSPIIDSQALAIEIKASWIEAKGLIDSDKFIKMTAVIPTYDKTNPNDWVPNGSQTVQLAMVGMHVVGSTKGHSELLWSTFEHVSNDPAAAYSYTKSPSGTGNVAQNTTGVWVFCSNGATGTFNEMHMMTGGTGGTHIVPISPFSISPSNIQRVMPWGLNGNNASGNAEVISLNNTVRSLLDAADIRRNYIQTGTTWTIFGGTPSSGNQVGTNILANTTMETFSQGNNCFSCHNTNTTVVSHIFNETKPLF